VAGRTDTIVKVRSSRGLSAAIRLAKAHVRYAVHRPDEHGLRHYRDLWDHYGRISKQAAYARGSPLKLVYNLRRWSRGADPCELERREAQRRPGAPPRDPSAPGGHPSTVRPSHSWPGTRLAEAY
jgi:hypothetical protein